MGAPVSQAGHLPPDNEVRHELQPDTSYRWKHKMNQLRLFGDGGYPDICTILDGRYINDPRIITTEFGRNYHGDTIKRYHEKYGLRITDAQGNPYTVRSSTGGSVSFQPDPSQPRGTTAGQERVSEVYKVFAKDGCEFVDVGRPATRNSVHDYAQE